MIGEVVRHIRFGEGVITKEENGKIHAKFEEGDKIFPYASFGKFVTCDNPEVQKGILEKAIKAEKAKDEKKASINKVEPDNKNKASRDKSKVYEFWKWNVNHDPDDCCNLRKIAR